MNSFLAKVLLKEILIYKRKSSTYLSPIIFFLISISLYPIAISNDPKDLAILAPGVTWICILLSTLLSIQNIFNEDYEDGSLDLMFVSRIPMINIVLIKIFINWLFSSLPLILLSFLMVFLLYLPFESLSILLLSLFIGTPIISLFGALAGALSLGKSSILGSAIVLPLSLPVLILGTSSVAAFLNGDSPAFYLILLCALFIFLLPLISYACIGSIRLHYE